MAGLVKLGIFLPLALKMIRSWGIKASSDRAGEVYGSHGPSGEARLCLSDGHYHPPKGGWPIVGHSEDSYLVDPASSHMLVSKIKPCMSKYKQFIRRNCEWLIKSVIVYLMVPYYLDNRGNSRANTC